MSRSVSLLAVCATFLCSVSAAPDEADTVQQKLAAAKEKFAESVEKARAGLLADLKKKQQTAQRAGDLKTLEAVQSEAKAFESGGGLPKSVPVRTYESQMRRALSEMEEAYETAVKQYTKEGNIALAKAVQMELDEFRKSSEGNLDRRNRWIHETGEFARTRGNEWEEKSPNGKTYRYQEAARTGEYVELHALNGDTTTRYRIYEDRADIGKKTEATLRTMFRNGKWAR